MSEAVRLEKSKLEKAALEDDELAQTLEDDEQSSQDAALDDDERPTSRSDAKDPWHGLNDFDEE